MANANFIQEFDESLKKLGQLNDVIVSNTQSKKDYSTAIIQNLKAINEKIKGLLDKVKQLKAQVVGLQGQVDNNTSGISNNETQINQLQQQVAALTAEKMANENKLQELTTKSVDDAAAAQQKIDTCEQQVAGLTQQNATIQAEVEALKKAAEGHGDQASQIDEIAKQNAAQLKQLQDDNNTKMTDLQNQINQKDAEIARLTQESTSTASQIQAQLAQQQTDITAYQQQITVLQKQSDDLKQENDNLIQRIIAATTAINDATQNLQQLSDPTSYNQAELAQAFDEIEKSIQDISNVLQGSAPGPRPGPGPRGGPRRGLDNPDIHLQNIAGDKTPFTLKLQQLIDILKTKPQKNNNTNDPSKYAIALKAVREAKNEQEVIAGLTGVDIKNNTIMGGKKYKTKKNRKQKGGFKYSNKAKRTAFSFSRSTLSNRKSSRSHRNTTTKR
jgi:predicted  nucleic acid-binding Zn-ribbon protein